MGFFPRSIKDIFIAFALMGGLFFLVVTTGCAAPESGGSLSGLEEASQESADSSEDDLLSSPPFDPHVYGLEVYDGLPVGLTEEGYLFRGNPEAPVTLIEYSDYLCPFCSRYEAQTLPSLLEIYGKTGQVKFVFRDFPLAGLHPTAPAGHAAALCAADQSALLFWKMHDELFATQSQWSGMPDPGSHLAAVAEKSGVDMAAYETCLAAGETAAAVDESVAEIMTLGFQGTPSFQFVSLGKDVVYPLYGAQPLGAFTNAIDSLLAGEVAGVLLAEEAEIIVDPKTIGNITFDVDDKELDTYRGLPVGFTEEGYPFIGNPEAGLTLVEFSDYLCPFCGRHFNQTLPTLLESYGASGELNFVFRDFPLESLHPTAPIGHAGALCAGEQGAALFWAMHDQLFATQQQWANLPDPTPFVAQVAEAVGVDMDAYAACMEAGETAVLVSERVAAGHALGFNGTPMFQLYDNGSDAVYPVNGAQAIQVFNDLVDTLLAGEIPEVAAEPDPEELPYWASPEGLQPDPERPGFTLAGDPFKGNPDAAVVVVEFSDFQCPACQQHALEIQPTLDGEFVETGRVLWVYKNLPLEVHPQALIAAVAAECAGEQGRFWEMHHALFEDVDRWATDGAEQDLLAVADGLGLESGPFTACFNGRHALESVVRDMYDAVGAAESTPSFIILQNGRGRQLRGSRPAEEFVNILNGLLEN